MFEAIFTGIEGIRNEWFQYAADSTAPADAMLTGMQENQNKLKLVQDITKNLPTVRSPGAIM